MSATLKWLAGTIATLLSTELNSMANNALVITGSAYDNSSNLYLLADVELVCTFGTAPTSNTGFSLWFLTDIDGTNYEDGGTSVTPARAPDLVLPVRAVTSAQRITRSCLLPAGTALVLIKNDGTGQSIASSGNTLKIKPRTMQQV